MIYVFGRLIAAGPLSIRGPVNTVAPRITAAVEGSPVEFDTGQWLTVGAATITARLFSGGIALPDVDGVVIPGPALVGVKIYLVVTATDDSGATVQVVSAAVRVAPLLISEIWPEEGVWPEEGLWLGAPE